MAQDTLQGKVALVSGGATGIGLAAAALYLQHGAKVIIAGRRETEGQKALSQLQEISPEVHFIQTDVSQAAEVQQLITGTVARFGKLDIAFNNAGIEGMFARIEDMPEDAFDSVFNINVKGVWLSCKYEIEQFRKQGTGGAIVNTSSWLAKGALGGSGVYSASKAALDGLTRALAIETADAGIRINNIQPGYIQTPMFDRFFPADDAAAKAAKEPFRRHVPLGRFADPKEVAELVLWLSSAAASYITGESILADGGLAIGGQRL